jgi:outer membrane protein
MLFLKIQKLVLFSQWNVFKFKTMKRFFFLVALAFAFNCTKVNAQARVAYIDSEYILDQMPEYRSAQKQLDEIAQKWKDEVQKKADEIEKQYKDYQAQYVLLPEDQRKKKEQDITDKEKALAQYKKDKFGPDGELDKKRQQLIKPVQDKVFDAVQQLAKQAALDIIFDKSGAVTMMYTNAKYDRSDDVLEILGINKKTDEKK